MSATPPDDRPTDPDARPDARDGADEAGTDGGQVSFTSGPVWMAALRAMARIVDIMLVGLAAGSVLQLFIDPTEQRAIAGVALNLTLLLYFVAAEMRFGSSVGKRLFKIRAHAVGDEQATPGFSSALLRNAIVVAVAAGGFLGLIIAAGLGVSIVMGRGRGFHDRITNVVVESTRP